MTDDEDVVDDTSSTSGVGCITPLLLLAPCELFVEDDVTGISTRTQGKEAISPDVDNDAIEPNGSSLLELT